MNKSSNSWLSEFMKNNVGLKLIALLLAVLTYIAIHEATNFEITYDIPVDVEKAAGVAILEQDPIAVQVTFRGAKEDLRQIRHNDIKAAIKCSSVQISGSEHVLINPSDIQGLMPSVKAISIRPHTVKIKFDRETSKVVKVSKPRTVGSPLSGRAEIDFTPKTVTLTGPGTRLKDQEEVDTEPVDVDGRVESFIKQIRVLSPAGSWATKIEPAEITAKVSMITESVTKEIKGVPVRVVTAPGDNLKYTIEPATVDITVKGRVEEVGKFAESPATAFVEVSELDTSSIKQHTAPVNVLLKPGIDVDISVSPKQVNVKIMEDAT